MVNEELFWRNFLNSFEFLPFIKPPMIGHPRNRVCTCREEIGSDRNYNILDREVSFFVPGYVIHLKSDMTYEIDPDCEGE